MGREMSNTTANQKQQSAMSYTVEQLIAVNPYNPDILPDLENYVNEQVRSTFNSLQNYLPIYAEYTLMFFWERCLF